LQDDLVACAPSAPSPATERTSAGAPEDGGSGRGIQYPFGPSREDEYHAPWDKVALDQWKMMICILMRHHAADPGARLWQIPTEFIRNLDYGEGCQYSLFEQGVACVKWVRAIWDEIGDDAGV
jgi:hypothetical protein